MRYDSVEDLADALRTHACQLEAELARCREALAVYYEFLNDDVRGYRTTAAALRDLSKPTPEELP